MARSGLARRQKQLQPAFFYDALGSALFDAITRLPEYTITRAELSLLQEHAEEILGIAGENLELVELGPGNGEKLIALAQHASEPAIHLIDVSSAALQTASSAIARACGMQPVLHEATFEEGLKALGDSRRRRLVLFLGSNIGNFALPDAGAFLRQVHASLRAGDLLLLGADLVKPEADLLLAYDDPLGVTSAFNKNLLVRMNRELGASFDLAAFDHRSIWNAAAERVEMHLVSLVEQTISIASVDLTVHFAAGETIWTESSHKYTTARLLELCTGTGFRHCASWVHDEHQFAEMLFTA
jgi:dimethylhistidine N-methyltransferase